MSDYGLFYKSWKNKIFNYLMRVTGDGSLAGDIMQETFTRHFDHYGETNRDIPLLYRIARNLFMDEMRRGKTRRGVAEEEGEEPSIDQDRRLMIRFEYRRRREDQAGAVLYPFHAGVGNGAGKGIEKDDRQRNTGNGLRCRLGIEQEQNGHEDETAPGADQRAVSPDDKSQGNQP